MSLGSLGVGETVGILCKSRDRTLHFFINDTHLEVKLPKGDVRLPSTRYAVVDLYGQCCAVELKPLQELGGSQDAANISISIEKEQLSHTRRTLKGTHQCDPKKSQEKPAVTYQEWRLQPTDPEQQNGCDERLQIEPERFNPVMDVKKEKKEEERSSLGSPQQQKMCDDRVSSCQACPYYRLCKKFLERLPVPGMWGQSVHDSSELLWHT